MASFNRIAVVGAGLIGGSILLAAARKGLAGSLACWSRSAGSRETLRGFGVAEVFEDPADCVRGADLVIVTTPVDTAEETFLAIAPGLAPGAVVTDAGSVKGAILVAARRLPSAVSGRRWVRCCMRRTPRPHGRRGEGRRRARFRAAFRRPGLLPDADGRRSSAGLGRRPPFLAGAGFGAA
ncbi:MAG: prephenate dehydrogenase/arogenate dehydrogenase family protein [Verrucomicrobia bacterium]|nr:prephenate dehydrogenase/arogenate dehydrogenase family protein [Verrucomicrobiota bacterium]